ncbi:TPA: hypothetical protein DDZ01_04145 [Candidatus Uhrbacteria bacterium]|nr:hypothetical protein [Candidatus Uhrbacteria bacterium]
MAFVFSICALSPANASSLSSVDDLQAGDLIRGQSFSAVYYYGVDGFRYVFPNDKVYFTWYTDFDDVKWISDTDMTTIQIGGNVTYKPGVKMIKITSDPKTYAVSENGTLQWVSTEQVAIDLYGNTWNTNIDDVPDAFFGNYTLGQEIEESSSFSVIGELAAAYSIDADKGLKAARAISITASQYSPSSVTIDVGTAVRWTNNDSENHSATEFSKDWGSGTMAPGVTFARYFNEAGTYEYYDKYSDEMIGIIIVE